VSPGRQRQGFGRHLMQEAERILHAAGCPKINLHIRSTNQQVITFYHRLGFQVDTVTSLGKRLESDL
jgi:ribosomal protein S18 acetylase RimI-like enzyme